VDVSLARPQRPFPLPGDLKADRLAVFWRCAAATTLAEIEQTPHRDSVKDEHLRQSNHWRKSK
jgi:hypothetical protein